MNKELEMEFRTLITEALEEAANSMRDGDYETAEIFAEEALDLIAKVQESLGEKQRIVS
jgi:hypothetical protein